MELTYRYRLYPTKKQQRQIVNTCNGARYLYNQLLAIRTEHYRKTKQWCELDMASVIEQNGFLQELDQSALYWSVKRLEQAYKGFFNRKPKVKERFRPETQYKLADDPNYQMSETDLAKYPRYKRKKQIRDQSYTTSAPEARIENDRVFLPYVGFVKIKMHRALPQDMEQILRYTVVVKQSGRVYLLVHFTLPDVSKRNDLCRPLGIVFDPMRLAVRSDGVAVTFSHTDPKLQKRIDKLKKELKRSVKGSKAFQERQRKLALLYEKQKNQRWDSLHKITRQIANAGDVDTVYMETPAVRLRKRQWAKVRGVGNIIQDEAWWSFSEQLRYKLEMQGKHFCRVDETASVRGTCCNCGAEAEIIPWQSQWVCPHCGVAADSELNGALNLRAMAEAYIQSQQEMTT